MSITVDRIINSAAIVSVFGRWPSFHDAEVLRVELSRQCDAPFGPALVAGIHVFSMTSKVDERGYFVLENHCIAVLKFDGVDNLELGGFNHQNALSGLDIAEASSEGMFEVHFHPAYGVESQFTCRAIEVISVTPGLPPTGVYARAKA